MSSSTRLMIGGLIPDSNDLQQVEEANDSIESQRKRAASEVSTTSNTSVRDQPPVPKMRRMDG